MKKSGFLYFLLLILASCNNTEKPLFDSPVVSKLADGFIFTEGPAADGSGNVYFSDIPNSKVHIWTMDDRQNIYLTNIDSASIDIFSPDSFKIDFCNSMSVLLP